MSAQAPAWSSLHSPDWTCLGLHVNGFRSRPGREEVSGSPRGLGWGPANICKPVVWPFAAHVLIFKELQRQHLETKPHSCRPASWAGTTALPLLLAPRRHIMWSGSIWKNSLQCCKLKGATLFLLTPAPLPEKKKKGHAGNPEHSKAKGHWALGPKQEAELGISARRLDLRRGPGAERGRVTQSCTGPSRRGQCGSRSPRQALTRPAALCGSCSCSPPSATQVKCVLWPLVPPSSGCSEMRPSGSQASRP